VQISDFLPVPGDATANCVPTTLDYEIVSIPLGDGRLGLLLIRLTNQTHHKVCLNICEYNIHFCHYHRFTTQLSHLHEIHALVYVQKANLLLQI
jgi:hypothetical protein